MSSWKQQGRIYAQLGVSSKVLEVITWGRCLFLRTAGVLPINDLAQPIMVYSINCKWIHSGITLICSFCIETTTTARQAHIPDTIIKMLGRCKSDAYQSYIPTPLQELSKLLKYLI